ncbi:hypothetical protein NPIL_641661, partial [Nephila pilipes]
KEAHPVCYGCGTHLESSSQGVLPARAGLEATVNCMTLFNLVKLGSLKFDCSPEFLEKDCVCADTGASIPLQVKNCSNSCKSMTSSLRTR